MKMAEGGLPGPAPHREDPPPQPTPQPTAQPIPLQPGQQAQMHMNWSHLSQNIPVNLRKMLGLIC